jgi:hypothetical protein
MRGPHRVAGCDLIACLGVSVPMARVNFAELDRFIAPLQKAAAVLCNLYSCGKS